MIVIFQPHLEHKDMESTKRTTKATTIKRLANELEAGLSLPPAFSDSEDERWMCSYHSPSYCPNQPASSSVFRWSDSDREEDQSEPAPAPRRSTRKRLTPEQAAEQSTRSKHLNQVAQRKAQIQELHDRREKAWQFIMSFK